MTPEQLDALKAWVDARIDERVALLLRRGSGAEERVVEKVAWEAFVKEIGK